jgi:glycosyltransferase involved in cell wall biosynthesis
VRSRHPGRRTVHLAGDLLELSYRLLSRRCPTVVVGPELARNYSRACRLLSISVSLVRDSEIGDAGESSRRSWDGERTVLTVGRLEREKNPLMLADVLERLDGSDWRLVICGEGPLEGMLRARLRELGVEKHAELLGYVPIDRGLLDLYRAANAFLHVSWTEGMPQVLLEAFASGTPVVATAVGGVPEAAGDAALLIPPGDPDAAARALERLASDPDLRRRLVTAGIERLRGRTLEAQSAQVARFLADAPSSATGASRAAGARRPRP